MRSAEVEQLWSKIVTKERGFRLSKFSCSGKPPLKDQDATLANGMTVVCGLNGVGKTTALRLIEAALNGSDGVAGRCRPELLAAGEFVVHIELEGETTELSIAPTVSQPRGRVLDAFELCARVRDLARQPNFTDLLEGVEPYSLESTGLSRASHLIGREYDELEVFEIEDPSDEMGEAILPIFRARVGSTMYGVASMGLGELAGLELLWHIERARPNTVLLIEEPETFLSSMSTTVLLDVVADAVVRQRLYAVVVTHAPEAVSHCPLDVVRVLAPSPDWSSIEFRPPASRAELEHLLQTSVGQARLVLTEDRAAASLVTQLLARFGGLWGRSVDVQGVGGESVVRSLCRQLPESSSLRIVGVLDGDQEVGRQSRWPVLCLPTSDAPDTFLRRAALENLSTFAGILNRARNDVEVVAASAEGRDDHDWFAVMSQSLMIGQDMVRHAATSCWLQSEANAAEARTFVDALTAALLE